MAGFNFKVVVADPPWKYTDKKLNRGGAERHYSTMSLDEIKRINVKDNVDDNAALLMWATGPLLPEAIEVMGAWGFEYKNVAFVWVKRSSNFWENLAKERSRGLEEYYKLYGDEPKMFNKAKLRLWFGSEYLRTFVEASYKIGMGYFTRANAEFVLLGVRGNAAKMVEDHGVRQIIDSPIMEHSRKPCDFFNRTNRLFGTDVKRVELFSRRRRDGWELLGDYFDNGDYYLNEDFEMYKHGDIENGANEREGEITG